MILGTLFFSIIKLWLKIISMIILKPIFLIKISFLWFGMAFAVSYIFFLMVHKSDVIFVRKAIAKELGLSLIFGFLIACLLEALYEFILFNVSHSKFFEADQLFVNNISLLCADAHVLYQRIGLLMIMISGLFAAHRIGEILDQWYAHHISNRYSWIMIIVTLFCAGFIYNFLCLI